MRRVSGFRCGKCLRRFFWVQGLEFGGSNSHSIKPDHDDAHYTKACYYELQDNYEGAIDSLQRAIELDRICRGMAKRDTAFDGIRDNEQFQALVKWLN